MIALFGSWIHGGAVVIQRFFLVVCFNGSEQVIEVILVDRPWCRRSVPKGECGLYKRGEDGKASRKENK